jgi:hypothetical protein
MLSNSSQIRGAVGRCAVLVIVRDLPGDGIMYWPKQVALQLGTVTELSHNCVETVRVTSGYCRVTITELSAIRELSGDNQRTVRGQWDNCEGSIREVSDYLHRNCQGAIRELSRNYLKLSE